MKKTFLTFLLIAAIVTIFYLAYHKNETKPTEPTFQVASPYQDDLTPPVKTWPCDPAVHKC